MISAVVVNWNAGPRLAECVESLRPDLGGLEAVVVDNGSTDASLDELERLPDSSEGGGIRLIANDRNRGLAAAMNQGAIAASGEVILFTNPDVVFPDGAAERFIAALDRHPGAGAVVPRARFGDGELQTTAGDLPTLREALAGRQRQWRRGKWGNASGFCWDGWAHDTERGVGRAGDVCFAVRREAFAAAGMFDERFPLDWESVDWSARLRDAGWDVWFTPEVEVTHHAGTSTSQAGSRWVVATHVGMYRYFAKRKPAGWRPVLALLFAARAAVKLAAVLAGLPLHEMAQRPRARPR